jgi:ankyrin repeat domain-containing protein 50
VCALDVEETLQAFPTDIHAIYTKTWERICAQEPKLANLAKLVLLWITHAETELTIDTLRRAVATSPETHTFEPKRMVPEALLLSVCCGLVSLDKTTRFVRLIREFHPRVRKGCHLRPFSPLDYTARDAILPKIQQLYPVPHAILAHVCIAHLVNSRLQNFEPEADRWQQEDSFMSLCKRDNLLAYAYSSWRAHTRQCGRYSSVLKAVSDLVLNSTSCPLGASVWNVDFGGPLHVAVAYSLQDLILPAARLQSPNALTTDGWSPLHLAIKHDHLACAQTLLSVPDINVNVPDRWGCTPLMSAARRGNIRFVQLLVEASGININAVDEDGRTALIWAAKEGQTEAVQLLLGRPGINVNATDADGWTALIYATSNGHTGVVQQLLNARDIDVNIATPGSDGWQFGGYDIGSTALMIASQKGYIGIVKHLLEAPGIDLSVTSRTGRTALWYASAKGHTEIVNLLLPFTASTSHNI